jgi:hypothetical protein
VVGDLGERRIELGVGDEFVGGIVIGDIVGVSGNIGAVDGELVGDCIGGVMTGWLVGAMGVGVPTVGESGWMSRRRLGEVVGVGSRGEATG